MATAPNTATAGSGGTPQAGGVAGAGTAAHGSTPVTKGRRAPKGSTTNHIPGKRSVKEYPITEETLDNIGVMKKSSATLFAVASVALGFFLSDVQSLSFAGDSVTPAMWATWATIAVVSFIVAVAAALAGLWFNGKEKDLLQKIKDETEHAP